MRLPVLDLVRLLSRPALWPGVLAAAVGAQCAPQWLPGDTAQGIDGIVNATTTWDPDGPGPATPKLVGAQPGP